MVLLVALIFWGLKTEGDNAVEYILKALEKNFIIDGHIVNGYFVTFIILNTLWIHLPVLIVIIPATSSAVNWNREPSGCSCHGQSKGVPWP